MEITPKVQNRKAVAPIIATLLLVAIAVVGGIIVFVWASGMFGSTSGTALPTAESIQLVGYDSRDVVDLTSLTTLDNGQAQTGKLAAGTEYIVLKVRNTGSQDMIVDKIIIQGVEHTWEGPVVAPAKAAPGIGKFQVYSKLSGDPVNVDRSVPSLAPGEDGRIAVKLQASPPMPDDISTGRNLQVKIKTSNGSAFNFFVITGQSE